MSLVGLRIGHFLVERELGAGGMGTVYVALDERLKRRVALKALRRDRLSPQVRARFLREARVLSQLDHPNVCRVYEFLPGAEIPAGTGGAGDRAAGLDYLALELVEGESLRDLALDRRLRDLDLSTKLGIAEQLARAVAAAHEKGIVHRDLKPENVMLAPRAGAERYLVKVLDFGLAHTPAGFAADLDRPASTSSEQAAIEAAPAATFSRDETAPADTAPAVTPPTAPGATPPTIPPAPGLTGGAAGPTVPSDRAATPAATPAPRPFDEVTTRPSAGEAVETAHGAMIGTLCYMSPEQARGEPVQAPSDLFALGLVLQELFSGERVYAANLPLPALHKLVAAGETTPLAAELDKDVATLLRRLLAREPAARPSASDVVAQLVRIRGRRARRIRFALAAAAVLLVIAGLAKYALDLRTERNRALAAQATAEAARREAEEMLRFMVGLFEASRPIEARGEELSARDLLDRGATRVEAELADQPGIRSRLLGTIGAVYCQLGVQEQAMPLLERALAERRASFAADSLEVAAAEADLARCLYERGELEQAEALHRHALAVREAALGPNHPDVAETVNNLGLTLWRQAELEPARALFARALAIWEASSGPDSLDTSRALNNLGEIAKAAGNAEEAEALLTRALAIKQRLLPANDLRLASAYNNLGELDYHLSRYPEAEANLERAIAIWEEVLGPDHPDIAAGLNNLASVYDETNRSALAETTYRRVAAIYERAFGPNHHGIAIAWNNLGEVAARQGRRDEAIAAYRRSLAIFERALGPRHPILAHPLLGLAKLLADTDRAAARALAERAVSLREAALGADHGETVAARAVRDQLGS
jgi:serine/threonine protein kinase/tetratricopeptide (TPR) repeat protein